MNDVKTKQQIVDKIKSSSNVLVTVSNSPSVDALSAALGLSLVLTKLKKHATAIFSGSIPPAITFLEPEKTFEGTTDSLRDFIIALDKEKADHLRYKVDGDMVKIFITPYKTTISSKDLDFSQGDYNVELVLALGVDNQEHLDKALESHGQILHDATVITATASNQPSTLGSINWNDMQASSLSEMVVGLTELLKTEGSEAILDQQNSTAFLTGIVAETARFSNGKTSSKAMNMAAQLMAAGADQQLVATKLQEASSVAPVAGQPVAENSYSVQSEASNATDMKIDHSGETLTDLDNRVRDKQPDTPAVAQATGSYSVDPSQAATQPEVAPATTLSNNQAQLAGAYAIDDAQPDLAPKPQEAEVQSLGGTLNATTEQAHEDNTKSLQDDQNSTILEHHSYLSDVPANTAPMNSTDKASGDNANVDIFSGGSKPGEDVVDDPAIPATEPPVSPVPPPMPPGVAASLPQPPPLPDFANMPPPVSLGGNNIESSVPDSPPDRLGDILAPEPSIVPQVPTPDPTPPMPAQPSQSPPPQPQASAPAQSQPQPVASGPQDPAQFQIPGQV